MPKGKASKLEVDLKSFETFERVGGAPNTGLNVYSCTDAGPPEVTFGDDETVSGVVVVTAVFKSEGKEVLATEKMEGKPEKHSTGLDDEVKPVSDVTEEIHFEVTAEEMGISLESDTNVLVNAVGTELILLPGDVFNDGACADNVVADFAGPEDK